MKRILQWLRLCPKDREWLLWTGDDAFHTVPSWVTIGFPVEFGGRKGRVVAKNLLQIQVEYE